MTKKTNELYNDEENNNYFNVSVKKAAEESTGWGKICVAS
jgi:hypothetical protein